MNARFYMNQDDHFDYMWQEVVNSHSGITNRVLKTVRVFDLMRNSVILGWQIPMVPVRIVNCGSESE